MGSGAHRPVLRLLNGDKKRGVFNIYLERIKKKEEERKRKQLLPAFKSLAADTDAVQADGGNFNLKGNSVTKTPHSSNHFLEGR